MYIYMERVFIDISFLMLLSATSLNSINLFHEFDKPRKLSRSGMTIASPCTTEFLVIRWFQTKHLPLSNLYESSMFPSWSFPLLYIMLEVRNQNGLSGATTAPSAMLTHAFATLALPEGMQQSTQLVPALQSHRSMTHVTTTLLSYATLLCGSLSAIFSSSISYGETRNYSVFDSKRNCSECSCLLKLDVISRTDVRNFPHILAPNSKKCQLINRLDRWTYQAISLGFSLLTIGILSGAVWANEAWGSYRSWDPKETWALVTRLIHATYLHTKITNRGMGEGPSAAASIGFSLVWIRFLGVNSLGIGLHNYGWLV
uniref:cytochrome c heme attachment protein n=1 Tax=Bolbitis x multipinna TaxID=2945007 RepID=UPI0020373AFB|nr:cytochrome c heme attachment protein [Bolbitis x multipinna]YP_010702367.1 cytochrome c heme attachment protein [Bolbitis sinensis]UQV94812.1 cytochrome c heme attachment protein [Bolbitis x multipinna]WCL38728.1 cytochrome c heme attachment protein [Bolbitis sinensis]